MIRSFSPATLIALAAAALIALIACTVDSDGTTIGDVIAEREAELAAGLRLEVTRCTQDGAEGRLTNNGTTTVDVFIEVDYEDRSDVIVHQGNAWVQSLPPGRTAEWESRSVGRTYQRCLGRIESVFAS